MKVTPLHAMKWWVPKERAELSPSWNMDHKAGYKISNKDKAPLCLIKRHVMSDV